MLEPRDAIYSNTFCVLREIFQDPSRACLGKCGPPISVGPTTSKKEAGDLQTLGSHSSSLAISATFRLETMPRHHSTGNARSVAPKRLRLVLGLEVQQESWTLSYSSQHNPFDPTNVTSESTLGCAENSR